MKPGCKRCFHSDAETEHDACTRSQDVLTWPPLCTTGLRSSKPKPNDLSFEVVGVFVIHLLEFWGFPQSGFLFRISHDLFRLGFTTLSLQLCEGRADRGHSPSAAQKKPSVLHRRPVVIRLTNCSVHADADLQEAASPRNPT